MNLFIYFGNRLNEGSKTKKFIDLLIEKLQERFTEYNVIFRNPDNTNLEIVKQWQDVISYDSLSDDKLKLKEEIMNAEVVVFISPVFVHNVSSYSKIFIDRFGSWVHTMPLVGKVGVPISLSSTNGNEFVNDYLFKVLSYWGLSTTEPMGIPLTETDENALESYINYLVFQIEEGLDNPKELISRGQENIFMTNRNSLTNYGESHPERIEFEQLGNHKFETFRDLLSWKLQVTDKKTTI